MRFNEFTKQTVSEGLLDNPGQEDSPVTQAITRRILMQRTDLLGKYGPEKVAAAIDEVADFVGDVDEIGSSDVSGWIRHVEQMLGNMGEDVSEGGFKNKTAVFSGYSNYMRSRAPNVFKQLDIKVLNKEYFEDEDIIDYTVIGDGDSLAKARATLETNPQFGGMILKQGVAEAGSGRDSWDSNMPGYQGDYGGAENWGRRNREDDEHHEIDRRMEQEREHRNTHGTWYVRVDGIIEPTPYTGKAAANAAALELKKQPGNENKLFMLTTKA